jgi:hypothetical protein
MAPSKKPASEFYDQNKGCPACGVMISVEFPGRENVHGPVSYPAMLYHYATVHPGVEPLADPGPDERQRKAEQAAGG